MRYPHNSGPFKSHPTSHFNATPVELSRIIIRLSSPNRRANGPHAPPKGKSLPRFQIYCRRQCSSSVLRKRNLAIKVSWTSSRIRQRRQRDSRNPLLLCRTISQRYDNVKEDSPCPGHSNQRSTVRPDLCAPPCRRRPCQGHPNLNDRRSQWTLRPILGVGKGRPSSALHLRVKAALQTSRFRSLGTLAYCRPPKSGGVPLAFTVHSHQRRFISGLQPCLAQVMLELLNK